MAEDTMGQGRGIAKTLIIIVIIVIIVIVGYFVFKKRATNTMTTIDTSKYQAVFLSNGQTYFGKVSNEKNQYVSLADVYYLVLKKPLQTQQADGDQTPSVPEYSLIKLGQEMHGPTDMSINQSQILFIENLRDDSKIVNAIKTVKK